MVVTKTECDVKSRGFQNKDVTHAHTSRSSNIGMNKEIAKHLVDKI